MKRRHLVLLLTFAPLGASADGFGFQTPSGNIYCNGFVSDGGGISCTIVQRNGPPAQPKPASCDGVWGHDFELEATGSAKLACATWPGHPQQTNYSDTAPYGVSADFGDITCTSERTGFSCRNRSGHGFFLSRRKQEIF